MLEQRLNQNAFPKYVMYVLRRKQQHKNHAHDVAAADPDAHTHLRRGYFVFPKVVDKELSRFRDALIPDDLEPLPADNTGKTIFDLMDDHFAAALDSHFDAEAKTSDLERWRLLPKATTRIPESCFSIQTFANFRRDMTSDVA